MKLFGKDLGKDLVVVAEAGVNHEGSAAAAVKLVGLAKEAGADAIKFQTYTPSRFVSSTRAESLARVSKFRLDEKGHEQVIAEGKRLGIPVFSSAISDDVVPFLAANFQAIKIASGDVDFEPVIRAAARQGKPVLLSTGNATLEEVDRAVGWVRVAIGGAPLEDRLVTCRCTTNWSCSSARPPIRRRSRKPTSRRSRCCASGIGFRWVFRTMSWARKPASRRWRLVLACSKFTSPIRRKGGPFATINCR